MSERCFIFHSGHFVYLVHKGNRKTATFIFLRVDFDFMTWSAAHYIYRHAKSPVFAGCFPVLSYIFRSPGVNRKPPVFNETQTVQVSNFIKLGVEQFVWTHSLTQFSKSSHSTMTCWGTLLHPIPTLHFGSPGAHHLFVNWLFALVSWQMNIAEFQDYQLTPDEPCYAFHPDSDLLKSPKSATWN